MSTGYKIHEAGGKVIVGSFITIEQLSRDHEICGYVASLERGQWAVLENFRDTESGERGEVTVRRHDDTTYFVRVRADGEDLTDRFADELVATLHGAPTDLSIGVMQFYRNMIFLNEDHTGDE